MNEDMKKLLEKLGNDLYEVHEKLDEAKRQFDKGRELIMNGNEEEGVQYLMFAMCLASHISKMLGTITPEMADKMDIPEDLRSKIM